MKSTSSLKEMKRLEKNHFQKIKARLFKVTSSHSQEIKIVFSLTSNFRKSLVTVQMIESMKMKMISSRTNTSSIRDTFVEKSLILSIFTQWKILNMMKVKAKHQMLMIWTLIQTMKKSENYTKTIKMSIDKFSISITLKSTKTQILKIKIKKIRGSTLSL